MFIKAQVTGPLSEALAHAGERDAAHLFIVSNLLDKPRGEPVTSSVKPLNRYSIQPGKTFATNPSDKNKYKILRVLADDIVVQDLATRKIQTFQVDRLLNDWAGKGIKEISALEDIIQTVRNVLGPVLGIFLTSALIAWLVNQIGR